MPSFRVRRTLDVCMVIEASSEEEARVLFEARTRTFSIEPKTTVLEICEICKTEEEASQQAECFLNAECKYADEATVKKYVGDRR